MNNSNIEMLIDIKMKLQDLRRDAESYQRCLIADIWQISDFIEKELGICDISMEIDSNMYKRLKEEVEQEIFYTENYFDKYSIYLKESIHKLIFPFREQIGKVNKFIGSVKASYTLADNEMKEIVKNELKKLENENEENKNELQ